MRRIHILLGAYIVVALCVTGCAPVTPAAEPRPTTPTDTAKPTPSPTPTPTPTPDPAALPAQVFGGDCETALSAATVSSALGAQVTPANYYESSSERAPQTRGGIACTWRSSKSDTFADVVILNLTERDAKDKDETYCYGATTVAKDSHGSCRTTQAVGEYWFSAVMYTPAGTTNSQTKKAVMKLVSALSTSAAEAGSPPEVVTAATAWKRPRSCTDLSKLAHVPTVTKSAALVAQSTDTSGGERTDGLYTAIENAQVFGCAWAPAGKAPSGQIDGFSLLALPGGAWMQDEIAAIPGATEPVVDGVERIITTPGQYDEGYSVIDVFNGANWIEANCKASEVDQLLPGLAAMVKVLNAGTAD
jgi:hypothetical protein